MTMAQYAAGATTQSRVFPSACLALINGHPKMFLWVNATKKPNNLEHYPYSLHKTLKMLAYLSILKFQRTLQR